MSNEISQGVQEANPSPIGHLNLSCNRREISRSVRKDDSYFRRHGDTPDTGERDRDKNRDRQRQGDSLRLRSALRAHPAGLHRFSPNGFGIHNTPRSK